MRARADVFLFAGPTLTSSARACLLARPLHLRPPVRRGDVDELAATRKRPGVIVLVDGVFHDTLAVGHAEIRTALERGFRVWGLSSMGAIRAREMASLGMRGFGEVYERFVREDDFQDDEVALLHQPTAPYRPASEPLVHLRKAIEHLVTLSVVGRRGGREVVEELKSRWYGERTIHAAVHALAKRAPRTQEAIEREMSAFERFRIKTLDLERFLERRPWLDGEKEEMSPP